METLPALTKDRPQQKKRKPTRNRPHGAIENLQIVTATTNNSEAIRGISEHLDLDVDNIGRIVSGRYGPVLKSAKETNSTETPVWVQRLEQRRNRISGNKAPPPGPLPAFVKKLVKEGSGRDFIPALEDEHNIDKPPARAAPKAPQKAPEKPQPTPPLLHTTSVPDIKNATNSSEVQTSVLKRSNTNNLPPAKQLPPTPLKPAPKLSNATPAHDVHQRPLRQHRRSKSVGEASAEAPVAFARPLRPLPEKILGNTPTPQSKAKPMAHSPALPTNKPLLPQKSLPSQLQTNLSSGNVAQPPANDKATPVLPPKATPATQTVADVKKPPLRLPPALPRKTTTPPIPVAAALSPKPTLHTVANSSQTTTATTGNIGGNTGNASGNIGGNTGNASGNTAITKPNVPTKPTTTGNSNSTTIKTTGNTGNIGGNTGNASGNTSGNTTGAAITKPNVPTKPTTAIQARPTISHNKPTLPPRPDKLAPPARPPRSRTLRRSQSVENVAPSKLEISNNPNRRNRAATKLNPENLKELLETPVEQNEPMFEEVRISRLYITKKPPSNPVQKTDNEYFQRTAKPWKPKHVDSLTPEFDTFDGLQQYLKSLETQATSAREEVQRRSIRTMKLVVTNVDQLTQEDQDWILQTTALIQEEEMLKTFKNEKGELVFLQGYLSVTAPKAALPTVYHCEIRDEFFRFFKSPQDQKPTTFLDLNLIAKVTLMEKVKFQIVMQSGDIWEITAEDEIDLLDWVSTLRQLCSQIEIRRDLLKDNLKRKTHLLQDKLQKVAPLNSATPISNTPNSNSFADIRTPSITTDIWQGRQGTLEMKGHFVAWKKKWVTVNGGIIWIRKEKDLPVQKKIHIYGSMMGEYKPEKGENTFQVVTDDEHFVFKAQSVTEMHYWLNELLRQKIVIEEALNKLTL